MSLYVITSNAIPIDSIKKYNNNYLLSLLHSGILIPSAKKEKIYYYDIFQQVTDDEVEDTSSNQFDFNFIERPDITEALKLIARYLAQEEKGQLELDEDFQEEMIVIAACPFSWNQQLVKYLNEQLIELGSEVRCLNIFTHYKLPSMDRLAEALKVSLNTNFIYPDDPVAFGYALYQAIGGMLL